MLRSVLAALALSLIAGPAADFPCDELWGERNAVHCDARYCFRTDRAPKAFGIAGCRYDALGDVPLSARKRADIAALEREERTHGCPR